MPETAQSALLQYGILGVLVVVFTLVIKYLYSDAKAERKAHELEIRAMEAKTLAKAEAWMQESYKQNEATRILLERLTAKIDARDREGPYR